MIYNPGMEALSVAEKEELQYARLQETLDRVYNKVPFYKEKFDEKGIKIDEIKNLKDIEKLPFTQKKDLRDNYPFGLFAEQTENIVRLHGSSGTSGKPTVVSYTK
ncbi:phenylacetate--CoA ligase, partial [Butyricicoccus sp. 1XD8-22]